MNDTMNSFDSSTTSPTVAIDLRAVVANWQMLDALAPSAETGAVVKANAYGTGMGTVAKALLEAGCTTFFVAHIEEATALRGVVGDGPTIFLFHGVHQTTITPILENAITPVLNSMYELKLWNAAKPNTPCAIHIDTGMNRLGIQMSELSAFKEASKSTDIMWVFSHLACSDDPESPMNAIQLERFFKALEYWPDAKASLSNTCGIALGNAYHFDLTRPGIGLYGGGQSKTFIPKAVATISAPILNIFEADQSSPVPTVGYGGETPTPAGQKLATIALGYADGSLRSLSNSGFVFLKDVKCPIICRISMDLITIDITNVTQQVSILDRVEFLGQHAHIEDQAIAANTITYELLTGMGPRIQRTYVI